MKQFLIINGPNLNLLGKREPQIYGSRSFETYLQELTERYKDRCAISYFQSNGEGALIDKLHEAGFSSDGIILNGGAYTHTSAAIGDAIAAIASPVVEVHISNVFAREAFRHHSYFSAHCVGCIIGLGLEGYRLAIDYFLQA